MNGDGKLVMGLTITAKDLPDSASVSDPGGPVDLIIVLDRSGSMGGKKLNDAKVFDDSIVTEIAAFKKMYVAEDYHQNYFNENGSQPYCSFVIQPKVDKFKKVKFL